MPHHRRPQYRADLIAGLMAAGTGSPALARSAHRVLAGRAVRSQAPELGGIFGTASNSRRRWTPIDRVDVIARTPIQQPRLVLFRLDNYESASIRVTESDPDRRVVRSWAAADNAASDATLGWTAARCSAQGSSRRNERVGSRLGREPATNFQSSTQLDPRPTIA